MLCVCGAAALLPVLLPSYRGGSPTLRVIVGALAVLAAGALVLTSQRAGRTVEHLALMTGAGVVSASVWNDGTTPALFGEALLYGWVLTLAFAFLPLRVAVRYLGLVAVALACALATHRQPEQISAWLLVLVGLGAPAFVVGHLVTEVERLAVQDPLTGLFNRRAFFSVLQQQCARAARNHEGLAVAVLDLDELKSVNDSAGHAAGDHLISGTASCWQRALRGQDVIARLGGDEFGVVLAQCSTPTGARDAVNRLLDGAPDVSVSVGVAIWGGEGPEALLVRADDAMYRAKRAGRNRVVVDAQRGLSPSSEPPARVAADVTG